MLYASSIKSLRCKKGRLPNSTGFLGQAPHATYWPWFAEFYGEAEVSHLTSCSLQTFRNRIEPAFCGCQLLWVELLVPAANLHAHDSGSAKDGI